jgi:hypothetical protein
MLVRLIVLLFRNGGATAISRNNPEKTRPNLSMRSCNEVEKYYEHHDKGRGSGYKQFKRWEYFNERRLDERGQLQNYGKRALEEFLDYRDDQQKSMEEQNYACSWEPRYPTIGYHEVISSGHNGGLGRVNCITTGPRRYRILSTSALPAGGIWKTTNGGGTYESRLPMTSNWESLIRRASFYLGVSGIAIDPTSPAGARVIYIAHRRRRFL